ncbi:tetratricopeptide repeat protein [Wolbachia endosymbiont of Folsomia candida]|uniref:tetratricopeptide repeat protein n=1 Tax=Wolbachia endosymbiont of Folsomia candida TaxID=169402 RepID=UPI000A3D9B80|nr:tetratricopeptide repeat protein [Wolbachia endosymbiont of Folsomia candida]APR98898.1 hypothetical protein ASM33_06800 [Wolbachia endosymbiont of Folsomia candida]
MLKSNQPGTSQQQQTPVIDRELNAICSRKTHLEKTLIAARRRYEHNRNHETIIPVVKALRDLVKICDELINYQGQDKDQVQTYKKQKEWLQKVLTKIVLTREQSLNLAKLTIDELQKDLKTTKIHYTFARDTDRQQTAIPLLRALRDLAEAWGEHGNYQEQDKDKLKSYQEQKKLLEEALEISKEGDDPIETVKTLHKLGNVHYCLKDLHREAEHCEKAKEYYQKALDINESINIGAILADMYNNIGSIDHASGDYQKAKENLEKALPIFKKFNGSDDIKVGIVFNNLGNVHRDLKNHEEAKKFFTDALEIYEKVHGPQHIEAGRISNKLGDIFYSLADLQEKNEANGSCQKESHQKAKELYEKAKDSHEKALHIYKKFYGPNHVIVAQLSDKLGEDYLTFGNDQKAKELYEKQLVIYIRDLSTKERRNINSIEVAEALRNVGNAYYNLDDFQNAKDFYQKELKIRERHYNSYITEVIDPYSNNMFKVTNEALEEKQQKEKVSREIEVAKTLDNLGDVYLALGDHQEAEKSYKDALKHYGSDSPFADEISEKLKKTSKSLIEATKSLIEQLKDTLAAKERNSSSDHFQVGLTLRDLLDAHGVLANAYGELQDYKNQNESLENQKGVLKKALPILEENFGPTNPIVIRLNKLAGELGVKPNSALDSISAQAAARAEKKVEYSNR